jgi:hypothetical protein
MNQGHHTLVHFTKCDTTLFVHTNKWNAARIFLLGKVSLKNSYDATKTWKLIFHKPNSFFAILIRKA